MDLHNRRQAGPVILLALFFFAASFAARFAAVNQTAFANGWDSYFYINQTRAWVEEGQMHVPDASLIYPLLRLVYIVVGDYVLMYKVTVSLLASFFSVALFHVAWRWSGNLKTAVVIGSVGVFSPHLTYFAAQYPKNLLGLVLFLLLLLLTSRRATFWQAVLVVVNFFGHRVTAVVAFIYFVVHKLLARLRVPIVYVVITFLGILLAAGVFLPGLLSVFDVERLNGIFSARPQFAPLSFVRTFGPELLSTVWLAEILAMTLIFIFIFVYSARRSFEQIDARMTALLIALCILIFPFFAWTPDGAAIRMFLVFVLLCPLLLTSDAFGIKHLYVAITIAATLIAGAGFSFRSYIPNRHDPPYDLYDQMAGQIQRKVSPDSIELIIAHKSLAEFIVYATRAEAMSWSP
ncbi:MAG TPA: hypothetical protein VEB86_10800, partial [Chryseosolibacter sp.]|nr:hypothetical protein [Chryseosolibacter sp.]